MIVINYDVNDGGDNVYNVDEDDDYEEDDYYDCDTAAAAV
jgi:hypothetical protein